MQYQNLNYYPQYQQPYNPYMQRMENLQQFQQAIQPIQQPMVPTQMSGANQLASLGKIVESMDIVKVTDIPMDGNMYYCSTQVKMCKISYFSLHKTKNNPVFSL